MSLLKWLPWRYGFEMEMERKTKSKFTSIEFVIYSKVISRTVHYTLQYDVQPFDFLCVECAKVHFKIHLMHFFTAYVVFYHNVLAKRQQKRKKEIKGKKKQREVNVLENTKVYMTVCRIDV